MEDASSTQFHKESRRSNIVNTNSEYSTFGIKGIELQSLNNQNKNKRTLTIKARKNTEINNHIAELAKKNITGNYCLMKEKKKKYDLEDLELLECISYKPEMSSVVFNNMSNYNNCGRKKFSVYENNRDRLRANNNFNDNDSKYYNDMNNKRVSKITSNIFNKDQDSKNEVEEDLSIMDKDYIVTEEKMTKLEMELEKSKLLRGKDDSHRRISIKRLTIKNNEDSSKNTDVVKDIDNLILNQIDVNDYYKIEFKFQSVKFNSILATIGQICNSTIRYTFLNFPLVFAAIGILNGFLLCSLMALMSLYSVFMLLKVHEVNKEM